MSNFKLFLVYIPHMVLIGLMVIGCSESELRQECTAVKNVLTCIEDSCRVEFRTGTRQTVFSAVAKGDIYCRSVGVSDGKVIRTYDYDRKN